MAKHSSFIDLIDDPKELKRVIDNYVFKYGTPRNFKEFESQFRKGFNSPQGENIHLTSDKIISFFESSYTKQRLKQELSKEEYEKAYGDGIRIEYISSHEKVQRIEIPKIQSKGYMKKGKQIKPYSRTKTKPYTSVQTKFIQVRKQKKISTKKITAEYNLKFKESPRTESGIKTKYYRIK